MSESLEKYCIRVTYYISAAHILSFDVAVIQCITLCHKNHMITHVLAFWHIYAMSFTITMSAMCYFTEIIFILKAVKSCFKGSYGKQNLILMVISYEIYETG